MELTYEGTSRMVQTQTWKIHVNEAGQGAPVVLLHGSGPGATSWSNFGPNMGVLAEQFHVIAVDMPGWGSSDAVTIDERDHVQALVEMLDALSIDKVAVIGNSMGGMTGLRFAYTHPERITHLITMGPGSPGPLLFGFGDGPSEGLKALNAAYLDPSPEKMLDLVKIMTFSDEMADPGIAEQRSETARSRPDHLANFVAGFGRRPHLDIARIGEIQVPTLLFHGRDDRVVHYEHSLKLCAMIPDSRLVLLNRCGHWAQLEHADEFNRLVGEFLTST